MRYRVLVPRTNDTYWEVVNSESQVMHNANSPFEAEHVAAALNEAFEQGMNHKIKQIREAIDQIKESQYNLEEDKEYLKEVLKWS